MNTLAFLAFEVLTYGLFALCLQHAVRHNRFNAAELIAALFYGVLLEWITLRQLQAYAYGDFLIMVDGAPVAVGAGWAVIIYTAMRFSDRLDIPWHVRALLDGLLALNIDLAMDAIAIRIGFWTWGTGSLDFEWFGVPWGNFWAWFIVVSAFSGLLRMFRLLGWPHRRIRKWAYVPLAVVLSVLILALCNALFRTLWMGGLGAAATLLMIGTSLAVVLLHLRGSSHPGQVEWIVFLVPLTFHAFFLAAGILFGFYWETPALLAVALLMLVISLALHRPLQALAGESG